jgi:cell division septation protein DedD
MTKAELIRRVAKNVGVPDTDAKIFFELFLKRISSALEIGQSIFVNDFGYFHLIKGSIKKPVIGIADTDHLEEEVEFVLYSEDKNLRQSDTKGLVFNIPFFDEDDFHPVDSAFSLSIGKPLIPLRGVPFDNIYMPASGYEYRRLIESKVEKLIAASEIANSEEDFPKLVIDARSYNSNQVQLEWNDISEIDSIERTESSDELEPEVKSELSEYEKQTKQLKNIAWDFGEDLSKQIEAESILDIADERINMDMSSKEKPQPEEITPKIENEQENASQILDDILEDKNLADESESVKEITLDQSSEKLDELLESENELREIIDKEVLEQNIIQELKVDIDELKTDNLDSDTSIDDALETVENKSIEDEIADEEFWKSTSKYFEPYKPGSEQDVEVKPDNENSNVDNAGVIDFRDSEQNIMSGMPLENIDAEPDNSGTNLEESIIEIQNDDQDDITNEYAEKNKVVLEKVDEKTDEYYEPEKKRNLTPFLIFPLIVIGLSLLLYWYLEHYKKNEVTLKTPQISMKSNNAKVIQREFDIPVTYPYLPKVNETSISESTPLKTDDQNLVPEKIAVVKTEQKKPEEKKISDQQITENNRQVKTAAPSGKSLNVGNNIFKYNNFYAVQVASFRSSSISENEAGKYRNKGYDAFVEEAEIPGRGTWYRVRVGNFSSKEEAQSFASKNIR